MVGEIGELKHRVAVVGKGIKKNKEDLNGIKQQCDADGQEQDQLGQDVGLLKGGQQENARELAALGVAVNGQGKFYVQAEGRLDEIKQNLERAKIQGERIQAEAEKLNADLVDFKGKVEVAKENEAGRHGLQAVRDAIDNNAGILANVDGQRRRVEFTREINEAINIKFGKGKYIAEGIAGAVVEGVGACLWGYAKKTERWRARTGVVGMAVGGVLAIDGASGYAYTRQLEKIAQQEYDKYIADHPRATKDEVLWHVIRKINFHLSQ